MASIIDKKLADAIDVPLVISLQIPCDNYKDFTTDPRNCIDPQLKPEFGERKGWHQINPSKMCASCACHWHLSCARNFALGVVR